MANAPGLRIGLLGGECTGKTELARRIADETGARIVPEYLREFVDMVGRPPRREEQRDILIAQRDRVQQVSGALVADPVPAMTAVYSVVYFQDDSLLAAAIEDCRHYDLLVWCDTDIAWQPDGVQRDGPQFRAAAHEVLATRVIPWLDDVHLVRGTPDERWATIRAQLTPT